MKVRSFLVLLCLFLCPLFSLSVTADTGVTLSPENWSPEANGSAVFHGVIRLDGKDTEGAVLSVSLETDLKGEDTGEVFFTEIGGKNLKVRDRKAVCTSDLIGGGVENTFSCRWDLPSSVDGLTYAALRITVSDSDENLLCTSKTELISDSTVSDSSDSRLNNRMDRLTRILLITAAGLWIIVLARSLILHHKNNH